MADERPTVAHVVRDYLPRSATFIATTLRHQTRVRPVVLARHATNRDEHPFEPVVELLEPGLEGWARRRRALAARARGWPDAFAHRAAIAARQRDARVLHAHFGPTAPSLLPIRERLGLPLVTTFYGFDLALGEREAAWREPYERLFAAGDRFVVEGPAMATRLAAAGAPADCVRVVEIGVPLDALPPFAPRREPGDGFVLLQCARFTEKKGIDLSIAAFERARGELGRHPQLWLVGDGPLEASLRERAGDGVVFCGSLGFAEYRERLARADCAIQPSRTAADGDTEGGAPTVLLEYQAAGVPVVATEHADIPYVLAAADLAPEEDVDGLAAALVAVFRRSPTERAERAHAGRALVERRHAAAVTAAKAEDVYFELLS